MPKGTKPLYETMMTQFAVAYMRQPTLMFYRLFGGESSTEPQHDDVIKWKHFPHYWPFVRGIPRSPVNSPHKGQWRGALMFTLIWARINGWINNREAGNVRHYRGHYDVTVMEAHAVISQSHTRLLNLIVMQHPKPFKRAPVTASDTEKCMYLPLSH